MRHSDRPSFRTLEDEVISESKNYIIERKKLYVGESAKVQTQLKDLEVLLKSRFLREEASGSKTRRPTDQVDRRDRPDNKELSVRNY